MDVELHLNCYYVSQKHEATNLQRSCYTNVLEWDMSTMPLLTYNKLNTVYNGSKEGYKDKKVLRIHVRDVHYKIIIQSCLNGSEHLTVCTSPVPLPPR